MLPKLVVMVYAWRRVADWDVLPSPLERKHPRWNTANVFYTEHGWDFYDIRNRQSGLLCMLNFSICSWIFHATQWGASVPFNLQFVARWEELGEEEDPEEGKDQKAEERYPPPGHRNMLYSSHPVLKLSLPVSRAMGQAILAPRWESIPNHITFAGTTSTWRGRSAIYSILFLALWANRR